jgi:hypothetical protein
MPGIGRPDAYRPAQAAVSLIIGLKDEPRRFGRTKRLDRSSGSVATLAQNVGQTPFGSRYCSTFET